MPKSKLVHQVTVEEMDNYEYSAFKAGDGKNEFLASDSLDNLKTEIRNRGWKMAWISTKSGCLSYGQTLSKEIPYQPRY